MFQFVFVRRLLRLGGISVTHRCWSFCQNVPGFSRQCQQKLRLPASAPFSPALIDISSCSPLYNHQLFVSADVCMSHNGCCTAAGQLFLPARKKLQTPAKKHNKERMQILTKGIFYGFLILTLVITVNNSLFVNKMPGGSSSEKDVYFSRIVNDSFG